MRLRNVSGANEKIEKSQYVINDYENHIGNFKKIFNNTNPIHIEIGMGKGDFIIENAIKYPNINFIGIEKYDSVIVRAISKLENLNISNLKLIRYDATNIDEIFKGEINTIYLNFSDPWPKNRHEHRRLTSIDFLKRYDKVFEDNKEIIMKTDNRHLFEFSLMMLSEYGYVLKEICLDLYKEDIKDNIPTEYELKFHGKGFPIYKVIAIKN